MSPTPSITDHSRRFADNRFVYPVLSRRSQGLSIGVNLNPDKVCNFDCIYCQVDRTTQSDTRFVEWETLLSELNELLARARDGSIWNLPVISDVPPHLRHVNDIAFGFCATLVATTLLTVGVIMKFTASEIANLPLESAAKR